MDDFDFKSPDYTAVFKERAERLKRIRSDPERLPLLKAFYRDNPAQFVTDWGCTFDPRNIERGLPSIIPFILFEKQIEFMDWVVGKNKTFSFIGQRGLSRSDCQRENRKQLVGLKPIDGQTVLPEGAQIVNDPAQALPMTMQGHVTSSYYSANLGHSIALAVVRGGFKRMGDVVHCPLADGRAIAAEIVSSVFYDPKGERQNV